MVGKALIWVGALLLVVTVMVGGTSSPYRADCFFLIEKCHPALAQIVDGIGSQA